MEHGIINSDIVQNENAVAILIANDNKEPHPLIGTILKRFSYVLDIATNGLEALEKFKTNHYDLILMDSHMPEMGRKIENTAKTADANTILAETKKMMNYLKNVEVRVKC